MVDENKMPWLWLTQAGSLHISLEISHGQMNDFFFLLI